MSTSTYVPSSFRRQLKNEFPHMRLAWDEEKARWCLWEVDTRGYRWFDSYIETPEGLPREPGDWLIQRLRENSAEKQGVQRGNVADRRAFIKRLYPEMDPWVCQTCQFTEIDVHGYPGCERVVIDDRHRRWCRECLVSRVGWKPLIGKQPIMDNPKLIGLMLSGELRQASKGELGEKIRSMPRRSIALPNVLAQE